MYSWMEQRSRGNGGYEGQPSKFIFSRNKKSRKHEIELVGEWSAVDAFKFEPIISNYKEIRKCIKNELNSDNDLEHNTYIYYKYNSIVPVDFSYSGKWNLEEEFWSLDNVIIEKKEIQNFFKYLFTSTRSTKKGRLGKMTKIHGFQSDPVLPPIPNTAYFVELQIKGLKNHDCYVYLNLDLREENDLYSDQKTFKLATELSARRAAFLQYSVTKLGRNYMPGAVLVLLSNSLKIQVFLVLMLVGRVTTAMLTDSVFEWKNTTNPVISTLRQRIALEWLYASKEPVTSMIFTRYDNSTDIKVPVGIWTEEGGFKPDPFISTELTLITDDIKEMNEKKVSLILENPIHIDYDLQYNCEVNYGQPVPGNNFSIKLEALRPEWTPTEDEKHATLGKDVTFQWEYKYPHKAVVVFIRRENNTNNVMDEVGYLYQGDVTQMEQFINRVNITITPNEDQTGEKIGLTLKNVSVEDFGWKYVCQITLGDGEQLFTEGTTLIEVKLKPNTVTPRTDSRTSTATMPPVDYNTIIVLVIGTFIISHISQD